jgi:hypothetical protein
MWLAGPAGVPGTVQVRTRRGGYTFGVPRGVAVSGSLLVHVVPDEEHALGSLERVLGEVCAMAHAALVKRLLRTADRAPDQVQVAAHVTEAKLAQRMVLRTNLAPDLVAAHVAQALALERITAADVGSIRFPCFRPRPLDAAELVTLLRGVGFVSRVEPDAVVEELSITDDSSELARLLIGWLGPRIRRAPPQRPRGTTVLPLPPLQPVPLPPPPVFAPPVPRPSHPLDVLVAALSRRLAEIGVPVARYAILEGERDPMLRVDGGLSLAADHPQLRAIAAACLARTAWADAAVDALTAHAATVLNVALTSVTDATEAHALAALLARS